MLGQRVVAQVSHYPWPLLLARQVRDHPWEDVCLEKDDQADDAGQYYRVPEQLAEDRPQSVGTLVRIIVTGSTGDHDGLGINHITHDAARGVGGHDEDLIQVKLLRRDALQASEKRIGSGIGAGEEDTQPPKISGEERIEGTRAGEGQSQDRIGAGVAGQKAQAQYLPDNQDGDL